MSGRAHGRPPGLSGLVVAVAVLAAACGGPEAARNAPAARPTAGGRVVEGLTTDVATLDPIFVTDVPSGRVTGLLYEGLIQTDKDTGEPRPNMATFTQSADGRTYSFVIDPRAVWSDGKPVIAQDWYVAKKLVALSARSVRKGWFQDIEGWREFVDGTAPEISGVRIDPGDPKRFTVTLTHVFCPAVANIAQLTLPAHVFGKYAGPGQGAAIDTAPENTAPTVFSGPFRLTEWRRGDQVILSRNASYWRGAPLLDQYVFKVVADPDVLAAQLKTGEVTFGQIEPKDAADMATHSGVRLARVPLVGYTYIGWRTDSTTAPALRDKRVRQALAYGLDLDTVIATVLFGEATRQVAHHVPAQWAYPDPTTLERYAYDPSRAEALIQEAGYRRGADGIFAKDGTRISFTIRTHSSSKQLQAIAQVASEQYRRIGVDARVGVESFQALLARLDNDVDLEAWMIAWSLGADADPYAIWHSSQIPDPATKKVGFGYARFRSADVDREIEEARTPSNGDCSIEARKKHYAAFNKILNDEQPYNFGWTANRIYVTSAALRGFQPGAFGVGDAYAWWLDEGR